MGVEIHQGEEDATRELRRAKAHRLRAEGHEPFPNSFTPRSEIAEIQAAHDLDALEPGKHPEFPYRVAGRLVARREHGKTAFLDLRDRSGTIQVYARRGDLGDESYDRLVDADLGDTLGVSGCLYVTKRKTLAIAVEEHQMLAKAFLRPPEKYHGLTEVEKRFRHRELDLMANAETRDLFMMRSALLRAIRQRLDEHGFLEIDTPILQSTAGGAAARPFLTHHNALDTELALRISTELYLKRALIGGLEKVYDIGKCFRNEGISHKHSPEFTMLEYFQSYVDWEGIIALTEDLVSTVAERVLGTMKIPHGDEVLDFAPPWRRVTVRDAIREVTGVEVEGASPAQLQELLDGPADPDMDWDDAVNAIYTKVVEPTLIQPTFVLDFPSEPLPLSKRHKDKPGYSEFFDVVVGGIELVSGSSDINDPDEQRERLIQQSAQLSNDGQLHEYNEDYAHALEYGLPPVAGAGLGVDRLLMILSGRDNLREVIPFPLMRDAVT